MKDTWDVVDPYEYFMGRWSRLVAQSFIDWLALPSGLKWLDVGCGSGALSDAIIRNCNPEKVIAVDQSAGFVNAVQQRLGTLAVCRVGNALALPVEDSAADVSVSGLVLNFIPEPTKALAEMKRVTMSNGTVAVYVWDYAGRMEFLTHFWDTVVELDPNASTQHEGKRFAGTNPGVLHELFQGAGLQGAVVSPILIDTHFRSFEDYWEPFLGGQGPAPTYVLSLETAKREQLRTALRERMPVQVDGSIQLVARAWAAKGLA